MQGYMYILKCSDGSFYTGSTKNLEQRLAQHQAGEGANHTRKRLPVRLVFAEEFSRIDEAYAREKQVQGWNRKKKQALIDKNWELLKHHARCQNDTAFDYAAFDYAQAAGDAGQPRPLSKANQPTREPNRPQNHSTRSPSEASRSLSEVEGKDTP